MKATSDRRLRVLIAAGWIGAATVVAGTLLPQHHMQGPAGAIFRRAGVTGAIDLGESGWWWGALPQWIPVVTAAILIGFASRRRGGFATGISAGLVAVLLFEEVLGEVRNFTTPNDSLQQIPAVGTYLTIAGLVVLIAASMSAGRVDRSSDPQLPPPG